MDPIIVFLAVAMTIIVAAFLLTWLFRKTINREAKSVDLNANERNGEAIGAWIGIDGSDSQD